MLFLFYSLLAVFGSGCTQFYKNDFAELKVFIPALIKSQFRVWDGDLFSLAAPVMSDFDCVRINVVGRGIPDAYRGSSEDQKADAVVGGQTCSYPGIMSDPVSSTTSGSVTLSVKTGSNRVIQIVAVEDSSSTYPFCDSGPLEDCNGEGCVNTKLYELGRSVLNIQTSTNVSIANTYDDLVTDAARLSRRINCGGQDGASYTTYVYVATTTGSNIHILKQNTSNLLETVGTKLFTNTLKSIEAAPNGKAVFVLVDGGASTIQAKGFSTNSNGTLNSETASGIMSNYTSAKFGVSDNCIAVTDSTANTINTIPYSVSGASVTYGSIVPNTTSVTAPSMVKFSSSGAYLFARLYIAGNYYVASYSVNSTTCALAFLNQETQSSPSALFIKPDSSRLIALTTTGNPVIYPLSSGSLGAGTNGPSSFFGTEGTFDHLGEFLVAIDSAGGNIKFGSVSNLGAITHIAGANVSLANMEAPRFDPTGNFIFVLLSGGEVNTYPFNRSGNGSLGALKNQIATAASPYGMAILKIQNN